MECDTQMSSQLHIMYQRGRQSANDRRGRPAPEWSDSWCLRIWCYCTVYHFIIILWDVLWNIRLRRVKLYVPTFGLR